MHVLQISFYLDPLGREPGQLLQDWPTLVEVAEAVARSGAHVSVIQACSVQAEIARNGVHYYFVRAAASGHSIARGANFAELLTRLAPDVIHVHGLGFARDVSALAAVEPAIPIVIQDHADRVPRLWRRFGWRRGLGRLPGCCSRVPSRPSRSEKRACCPRASQSSTYRSPVVNSVRGARMRRGGSPGCTVTPACSWVGHLNQNKDPLTVLEGVHAAAEKLPGLRLWCCFGAAPLLSAVRRRISSDPLLAARVQLMGKVPHGRVESLMRSADFFVLGTRRAAAIP